MRRERNWNNKQSSCARLVAAIEKTKKPLYPNSGFSGLATVVDYSHAYITKGVKQSIAMFTRNFSLRLVADLHGYEVEVQQ